MATSKLLIFSIVLSLAILGIKADASMDNDVAGEPEESDSSLKLELEQLKLKIAVLESTIVDRTRELKSKDDIVKQKENIILGKSESISSLQSEIESLQGAVDAAELMGKAHARAGELEKQIDKLKNELQAHNRKRDAAEALAIEAEKKVEEVNLKLETLQRANDEQIRRIKKTEHALQAAEQDLMKVQLEAESKKKELNEVHGAWLPPWLAAHVDYCQNYAAAHWNEHGKPACNAFTQKVSHTSAKAQKWAEPHLETAKNKLIPPLKEKWTSFTTFAEPYVQSITTKSVEVYEASTTTLRPHVIRVQESVDLYFQGAKKFTKPYIDQVATITKPHMDKVCVVFEPYAKQVVYGYGKFLKSATTYHHQAQATFQETLKKYELTRALATKELVWFLASFSLALPVFVLYRLFSSVFCRKSRKPTQNANINQVPRRHKRRHADK